MAAPTVTAYQAPSGTKLDDGHSTRITFSTDPTIALWIKMATPPGVDVGDPIDNTDFHNTEFVTKRLQHLLEYTDGKFTCHYDPKAYTNIRSQCGREQSVTWRFSDGSTVAHWGGMKSFKPNELKKGEDPTAEVEIVVTNYDPDNNVEAGPVVTEVAGT